MQLQFQGTIPILAKGLVETAIAAWRTTIPVRSERSVPNLYVTAKDAALALLSSIRVDVPYSVPLPHRSPERCC